MSNNITCKLTKHIAVLSENDRGYTREVNFISWNEADAKLDIREWYPGHDRCGKGIALTEAEARKLMNALIDTFFEFDGKKAL